MIRWFLAHARDDDKEVEAPGPNDEVVILKIHEDWDGAPVEITFARAGDPLIEPDMIEVVAMSLYYKRLGDILGKRPPAWMDAARPVRRKYLELAGVVLGDLTQHMAEKRAARG